MQKQTFLSWLCCWDCLSLGTGICPSFLGFYFHYIDHISNLLELSPKVLNISRWSHKLAQVKFLVKLLLAFLARTTSREIVNETSSFCIVISLSTCSLQLKRNTSVLCTIPSAPASQNYSQWNVKEPCGEQHSAAAPPHCLLFSSCSWHPHTWEQPCCWCQEQCRIPSPVDAAQCILQQPTGTYMQRQWSNTELSIRIQTLVQPHCWWVRGLEQLEGAFNLCIIFPISKPW